MQEGARVSDILVVSPALDDYRTAIKTIFDQTPEKKKYASENDRDGFLHIPFAIVDSPARSSQTENVLDNLFSILEQGTITQAGLKRQTSIATASTKKRTGSAAFAVCSLQK